MNNNVLATILHISDLHFSKKIETDETQFKQHLATISLGNVVSIQDIYGHGFLASYALSNLYKLVKKNRQQKCIPFGVVLSGDLTRKGDTVEFKTGIQYLRDSHTIAMTKSAGFNIGLDKDEIDVSNSPGLFCIPGNHDIWGQHLKRNNTTYSNEFQKHFNYNYPKTWKITTHSRPIYIHGLDSTQTSTINTILARGRIESTQLSDLKQNIRTINGTYPDAIHIVVLHHPIIFICHKKTMYLENFDKIAKDLNGDVDLVLSGHIHENRYIKKSSNNPNHLITGTATQICAEKSCMLIDIYTDNINVTQFKFDKDCGHFTTKGKLVSFNIK